MNRASKALVALAVVLPSWIVGCGGSGTSSSSADGGGTDADHSDSGGSTSNHDDGGHGDGGAACKADCFGGECLDGVCQPVEIQKISNDPTGDPFSGVLAASAGHIYWATSSALFGAKLDGSDVTKIALLGHGATAITASSTKIYYSPGVASGSGPQGLYEVPANATQATGTEVALSSATSRFFRDMFLVGSDLYWTNVIDTGQYFDLEKTTLAGASPYPVTKSIHAYPVHSSAVAPDGSVYVVTRAGDIVRTTLPVADDATLAANSTTLVKTNDSYANGVRSDAKHLYWTGGFGLQRAALDGSDVTDLQSRIKNVAMNYTPGAVTLGDDSIFFVAKDSIYRWAKPE